MHEAMLYDKLGEQRVRCNTCQWRCIINPGMFGVCRIYRNQDGTLYNLNYASVSSLAADPIEKKPLFHFFPGSLALSLGSWGCNFHCLDCQNWKISCPEPPQYCHTQRQVLPEEAVAMAKSHHCAGIAWTYNEPSIWFEYTLDSARLAKKNNLYTVYVTNGYLTPEALDTIGPYLDVWRVDIKGFSDSLYRSLARIKNWRGILKVARRAKDRWRMHVEVVTNIIPTMNDDDKQLRGIASWIREELGELTPWHVTRFYPNYNLTHLPPTPLTTLEHACDIGRETGLKFVYVGNVPGHRSESTFCYSCDKPVVERVGYQAKVVGLADSRCRSCGAELNFRTSGGKEEYRG
ncbi:MAG: AmmeMemoRadiSam system radical SAM enzyme [Dehalococcoidales bacterium]|nr:AmmeMemoRadiSam system radical SAM enzyme [Dehalococcoidales bacterium]